MDLEATPGIYPWYWHREWTFPYCLSCRTLSPEVRVQLLWGVIRKPEFSKFVHQHILVSKAFVNLRRLLPQPDLYPKDLLFFQLDANVLAQSIVWAQIQINAVTGCFFYNMPPGSISRHFFFIYLFFIRFSLLCTFQERTDWWVHGKNNNNKKNSLTSSITLLLTSRLWLHRPRVWRKVAVKRRLQRQGSRPDSRHLRHRGKFNKKEKRKLWSAHLRCWSATST